MIIVELIFNLSLLIAVSAISGFLLSRWKSDSKEGVILQGLLFGLVAIIGMMNPFMLAPGIFFDGRSVVLSMVALFFGPVAASISAAIALVFRIYKGGDGALMGSMVILSSSSIGLIAFYIKKNNQKEFKTVKLYILGLLVHVMMVLLIVTIPSPLRSITYKTMVFTLLGIYPIATVLIGKILSDQQKNAGLIEALEVNEKQFRALANNMNQGLAVFRILRNEDGEIYDWQLEFMNEKYARITGLVPQEALGKTMLELVPETSNRTIQKYGNVAINGKPLHFESYSRELGIFFEADVYQPIQEHFAVAISDITQRKNSEKEIISKNKSLLKLNEEKDKLFSIISHDMRSPMNGILGLTEMMKEEIETFTPTQLKEISQSIHTSSSQILLLLNGLLEWSQLQRGNMIYNPVKLNLSEVAAKCTNLLNESARAKEITIYNKVGNETIVTSDLQMLETIVRNLISNSIKFTRHGGNIEIDACIHDNNSLIVSISDNGIGMSSDIQSKLFSLSGKINRKGTEGERSSGLGLLLCKELVEIQGGRIWADSEEGKGSKFYFTLKC